MGTAGKQHHHSQLLTLSFAHSHCIIHGGFYSRGERKVGLSLRERLVGTLQLRVPKQADSASFLSSPSW